MDIKRFGSAILVCYSITGVIIVVGVGVAIFYATGVTTPSTVQATTTSSGGLTCQTGWTAIANGCFKDMNKRAAFEDAKKICQEEGAYLPLFFNYKEVEDVKKILKPETAEYLVAATDHEKEGVWRLDYPPNCKVPWLAWVPGNPNNTVGHGEEGEDCAELIVAEGKMNDVHCTADPRWVVCHIRHFNNSCPSTRLKLCQSTEDCSEGEECDSYCLPRCQSHSDCAPPANHCGVSPAICSCTPINQECNNHETECCSGNCTNGLCHHNASCTFDFHCAKVPPNHGGYGTGACDNGKCVAV